MRDIYELISEPDYFRLAEWVPYDLDDEDNGWAGMELIERPESHIALVHSYTNKKYKKIVRNFLTKK